MNCCISSSFPLSICMLALLAVTLLGQQNDNPFGNHDRDPFSGKGVVSTKTRKVETRDDQRVKEFELQMQRVRDQFAKMAIHENHLLQEITRLKNEIEVNSTGQDQEAKEAVLQLQAKSRNLNNELMETTVVNKQLRQKIAELEILIRESEATARTAQENRNSMHQALFESLLNSDDVSQQEMAFHHLFKCADKYGVSDKMPISIYTPELLGRVSKLTNSESEPIRRLASRCLFGFDKSSAIEMGIQFGNSWRPLEDSKWSNGTRRIYDSLQRPCSMEYDELSIIDVIDEISSQYGIGVRLDSDVNPDLLVSYSTRDRSLADGFHGLLKKHELGYAIVDEELLVKKATDPELNVLRTYNVKGLIAEEVDVDSLMKVIKQTAGTDSVLLTRLNDHVFTAKASEANQRRIENQLGVFALPANWYSR